METWQPDAIPKRNSETPWRMIETPAGHCAVWNNQGNFKCFEVALNVNQAETITTAIKLIKNKSKTLPQGFRARWVYVPKSYKLRKQFRELLKLPETRTQAAA